MIYLIDFEIKAKTPIIKKANANIHLAFAPNIDRIFKRLKSDDIVFSFNYKDSQGFKKLYSSGIKTYPSKELNQLCSNRIKCVDFIDSFSKFKMNREVVENGYGRIYLKDGFVYKVGNNHQDPYPFRPGTV